MNRHINFSKKIRRYNHNMSYRNFFSGEIGELRPVYVEDAAPGDTLVYHPEARIYFAPLLFPVLTSMKARIDLFFVPNRLSWTEWESFISGGPDDNFSPAYPSLRHLYAAGNSTSKAAFISGLSYGVPDANSIVCNLGHPTMTGYSATHVVNDPFDGNLLYDYELIYDEYYRDEEKETSITAPSGVRDDVYDMLQRTSNYWQPGGLHKIAWSKDYFTTASLEQQRGGDIPLLSNPMFKFINGSYASGSAELYLAGASTTLPSGPGSAFATNSGGSYEAVESILTINQLSYLRSAAAWLNNNVVGGTRYVEMLNRRWHVVSSDARLQRPEMVGSIELPVQIDVITQASGSTDSTDPDNILGFRTGKGSIIGSGKTLTYSCEEFGYFIGILHVAPKAAYFQGMRRNLQREDKFDFYMPEFEHVPQREVRNNEIYCDASTLNPETGGVFAFQSQYSEMKHHNDEVHGEFQNSLLAWTMARSFASLPMADNINFLKVDNQARIFADPTGPHLFGVINNIALFKRQLSNHEPNF